MANEKIKSLPELERIISRLKDGRKRVVFTNGCFDLLHLGHIKLLAEAKKKGDILVVGLNSDRSVKGLKGPSRPILCQDDRAQILAVVESVDYVVIFDEPDPLNLIERLRPDVLIKGGDWKPDEVVGRDLVSSYGGEVASGPLVKERSTQSIIQTILERFRPQKRFKGQTLRIGVRPCAKPTGRKGLRPEEGSDPISPDPVKAAVYRILDANLNRSREGLRVCEDIARFILNSSSLTSQFRSVRHEIVKASKNLPVDPSKLLQARESDRDVGKTLDLKLGKKNWQEIFRANIQRAEEAIRALEEFSAVIDRESALSFQKIRFRLYSLEKRVIEPRVIYHSRQRTSGRKGSR